MNAFPIPVAESTLANKALVNAALCEWMSGNGNALQGLLSDDIEWTITGRSLIAGTTQGREQLSAHVLGPFGARFSHSNDPFRPRRIIRLFAEGNTVIVHFDGAGIANDGKPYTNTYLWMLQISAGKVIRATAFFDSIAFDDLWRRVTPSQSQI